MDKPIKKSAIFRWRGGGKKREKKREKREKEREKKREKEKKEREKKKEKRKRRERKNRRKTPRSYSESLVLKRLEIRFDVAMAPRRISFS